ncbi:WD40-repeat-containing domain protein [Mycena albidolilacea]|uniref:DNA damage-binding protein CMR1 n=1 Tax=Mycena albidolilacea TaxID=1033008 RepID=A0AAD6ZXB6_9AGAR|nr:WD40-repeat-containing domain protein [Mycena albidolilacea]
MPTEYELERERNIARNKALLEQLQLKQAVESLVPVKASTSKSHAKPIQSAKTKRPREEVTEGPRRQSARLRRGAIDPNESPSERKRREAEWEERRALEAEERMAAEERERLTKRARHTDLDLTTLAEDEEEADIVALSATFQTVSQNRGQAWDEDAAYQSEDEEDDNLVVELREKLQDLKVVSRAKVTQDRIYSAAYHPEKTKDLIFFGDKHGQLGIWDAQAAVEEVADEDGDVAPAPDQEGGKYWRLQLHWPATSKSSISCVKIDPLDLHKVYTSSYDCTIRSLCFTSGVSREIFSIEDTLISSIDITPTGHEMWISDALGGVWHRDLRQDKSTTIRYGLADQKIGCISINPTRPNFILTASNNRSLKIWDVRKLQTLALDLSDQPLPTPPPSSPGDPFLVPVSAVNTDIDSEAVTEFIDSKRGKACLRGEWRHDKSVSSAYWDPRGRSIVSTSYDDSLRLWDIEPAKFESSAPFPSSRPFNRIRHNCQTGKWLTILRAQWSPNPDVYPHFTIGNMEHSLDIFSCKGELITRLSDRSKISAVQAVTCSHPSIVERAVSGNGSGRCVLWAPSEED